MTSTPTVEQLEELLEGTAEEPQEKDKPEEHKTCTVLLAPDHVRRCGKPAAAKVTTICAYHGVSTFHYCGPHVQSIHQHLIFCQKCWSSGKRVVRYPKTIEYL